MFDISSARLRVTLLDPVEDRERFGTRFCTGGFIFQVYDSEGKPLMAGPTYPDSYNTFDGQGIPDAFHRISLLTRGEEYALIPGIGKVDTVKNEVIEFCNWTIAKNADSAVFETKHVFGDIDFTIRRTVSVRDNVIKSKTEVTNDNELPIPLCWYPHPFFPPVEPGEPMCNIPKTARFENPRGFFSLDDGEVRRVPGADQELSFQPVVFEKNDGVEVLFHTGLGWDSIVRTDFGTVRVPIWANDDTGSVEPYFQDTVFRGCTSEWSMEYCFLL